jgi:Fe-S oxidoreductase
MIIERPALQGLPRQIKRVNESLYTYHNPYRYIKTDRGKWAIGLDIKNVAQGDRAEWLYFAGCTADYEPRDEAVARGLAAVFRQASLDVGILGVEEICCGDPARFTGEQGLHEYIRDQNKELLDKYGVSRVVTACPHGYTNFKQEWEGTSRTVEHYTQLLYQLVKQGKLTFSRELDLTVTYHDSCYLGRYHGIYEEPRELLRSIPGIKLVEMKDNRNQSLCCGGGGGAAFLDVKVKPRLAWIRVRQAQDAGAGVIAVACPFCRSLLGDAVKDLESNIKVLQISELVSQAL